MFMQTLTLTKTNIYIYALEISFMLSNVVNYCQVLSKNLLFHSNEKKTKKHYTGLK